MGIFDKFKFSMKSKFGLAESPKLVYHFAKLIGLAPFTLKDNRLHRPTAPGLFYSIAVACTHLLLVAIATVDMVLRYEKTLLPKGTQIWGVTQYAICVVPMFLTLAVITSSRSKVIHLMNKLCDARDALESLGIQENPGKLFKDANVTTAIANAIIVTMGIFAGLMEPHWHIFRSIVYGIGSWFNLNLLLIYVQVLICIRQRFEKLNERLSDIFVQPQVIRSSRNLQMSLTTGRPIEEIGADNGGLTRFELIRKAGALHLDLSKLLDGETNIFTLPILLNSIQFFCVMAVSGQWLYSSVQLLLLPRSSPGPLTIDMFTALLSPVFRIAIALVQMTMIAHASTTTCQRGNATRATLIEMWNEFKPAELRDEFFMFSIQLAGEPVTVSISGIFDLNYLYVYKICGSAITYITVILQFGGHKSIGYYNKTSE